MKFLKGRPYGEFTKRVIFVPPFTSEATSYNCYHLSFLLFIFLQLYVNLINSEINLSIIFFSCLIAKINFIGQYHLWKKHKYKCSYFRKQSTFKQ